LVFAGRKEGKQPEPKSTSPHDQVTQLPFKLTGNLEFFGDQRTFEVSNETDQRICIVRPVPLNLTGGTAGS
jgi:hypothetical protein